MDYFGAGLITRAVMNHPRPRKRLQIENEDELDDEDDGQTGIFKHALSRNHAVHFRVERATGPFWRATSPTALSKERSLFSEPVLRSLPGGKLPPRTARLAVPPKPTASFRIG
jgi:hypothetical protein